MFLRFLRRHGFWAVVLLLACIRVVAQTNVDSSTLTGKFIIGYQGWHACQGDGSALNSNIHWSHSTVLPSTSDSVDDIWPDLSEYTAGELFNSNLTITNSATVQKIYSCYNSNTVNRHFKWMQDYGIDGVFAQRFTKDVFLDNNWSALRNTNLANVKAAAEKYGRVFAVEFDISNENPANVMTHLQSDWSYMTGTLKLTNSAQYLKHKGRPVIAIFGFGFAGGLASTPSDAMAVINYFHNNNVSVVGGVPYFWRFLISDSQTNADWMTVYHAFDVLSPWAVGRYQNNSQMDSYRASVVVPDLADLTANGTDYMPVVLPGYSAHNLGGTALNGIPRVGGRFYWRQAYDTLSAGCNMLFGAMFDEIDEGTAIYKLVATSNSLPSGISCFAMDADGENIPNDWYLRVAGQITKTVRGTVPVNEILPITPTNSITLLSPVGGETWTAGRQVAVNWSTTGIVSSVNIDLSLDAGLNWTRLAYGVSNVNSRWLTVPNVASTTCRLRVSGAGDAPTDWSKSNFTIQATNNFRPYHLTPAWSIVPGSRSYVTATGGGSTPNQRSIAYNALSNQVYIISRTGSTSGLTVNVLDATTGADLYQLNTTGISGGSIILLAMACADDGAIYAGNLSNNSGGVATFKLYRWANSASTTAPVLVYSGEPAGRTDSVRWGDVLAVQGTGTNTQVIIDAQATNVCAILTPTSSAMTTWISTSGPQDYTGSIGRSLQFGTNNTFWQKRKADRLEQSSFVLTNGTLTTAPVATYPFLLGSVGPVAMDFQRNLLAALNFSFTNSEPDTLDLYDISDLSHPALLAKYNFPTNQQGNGNSIGQIVFGGNKVFAIDGNNGVASFFLTESQSADLRFDISPTCCPCTTDDHLCQPQLDHLNWVSANGHFLAMGTDDHRPEIEGNGNALAAYYDTFTTGFTTNSAAAKAAQINQYVTNLYTATGSRPSWVVLNEISSSQWPTNAAYRTWCAGVVHELRATYGYNVILYSPFPNPGTSNASDWQAVAADAYIAIENYLSGAEIKAQAFSVSWCQSQYQSSINSYTACGVTKSRLMLGEHFAQTALVDGSGNTVSWGRNNVSFDEWDSAIIARSQGALNVGFAGFLSYAWSKNTLLVSDADLMHFEDTYRTNPLPAAVATTAPVIISSPTDRTNNLGTTATFSMQVSGTSPINYQWKRSGTNIADGGTISGAMSASLTITNVSAGDAGTYTVFVGNAASNFVSTVVLNVNLPPTITSHPQGSTNAVGANVSFLVGVSGTAPFTYQWQKNTVAVSGATNTALTLTNVQGADAGTYRVIVSNPYGSATSSNAVLSVIAPVAITSQPANQTNNYATTAVFSIGVTGYSPSYRWQKNGAPLTDGGNISGSTTATLSLANVTQTDVASYSVVVTNSLSSVTSSAATLTVIDPIVTTNPTNQTANAGATVSFHVVATGSATLGYQWKKNGNNLASGGTVSGVNTDTLTISSISTNDAGSYSVVVTNGVGSASSTSATLTVIDPVSIVTQPQGITTNAGATVTFSVSATGANRVYQWLKSGAVLSNGGNISGTASSTLTLANVTRFDTASYSVVITNSLNVVTSSSAGLQVNYPLPYNEPFNYTVGTTLGGQINANGLQWDDVGTSTAGAYITNQSGNLSYSGLSASTGNSIKFGGNGKSARFSFAPNNSVVSGTLYYSFLLKVTDTNGLGTGGGFMAGFNNSIGTQTGQPTVVGTRVYMRTTNGGFNIGLSKNSSTTTDWNWDPRVFTTNDTIFLVGSYQFNTANTTDDVSMLWINPASTNIGAGTPPPASLTNSIGSDITANQIASFVFFQRSTTTEAAGMIADELRIGTAWPQVAPAPVSAPAITTQPMSLAVNPGASATFSVGATGSPLSYQWQMNGTNISSATASTFSRANAQSTDIGSYSVVVSNSAGTVTSSIATLMVGASSVVTIDANKAVVVNGQKVFPILMSPGPPIGGVTPSGKDGLQEFRDAGALFVRMSQSTAWNNQLINDQQAYLNWAYQSGMYCMVNLRELSYFPSGDATTEASLRSLIGQFKSHPALGIWKNQDEAWWGGVSEPDLQRGYDVTKQEDVLHPVEQTHAPRGTVSDLQPYDAAADLVAVDIYPVVASGSASNPPITNTAVSQVGDWTRELSQVANGQRPYWMIEQIAFSGTTPPSHTLVFPTLQQSRFMAYQAIINGARGLMFFGGNIAATLNTQDAPLGWNWTFWSNVLKPVVLELGDKGLLTDALVAPPSALPIVMSGTSDPDVEFCVREVPPYIYVLASKREGSTTNVTFSGLPNSAIVGEVLYELGRTVTAHNGQFSDSFAQWDVHVYRFAATNQVPTITAQPQNQTNNIGTTATFSVTADGTGPLSYQWRKDGSNLSDGGNISGANSATLTIVAVGPGDGGGYSVVVSNVVGSVTGSAAALVVPILPTIITQPASQSIGAGSNAVFTVDADGAAPLMFQWRFNGGNISGATNSLLTIAAAQTDAGSYSVIVSNNAGFAISDEAVLRVIVPPVIQTQPQSFTAIAGSNALFIASASGTPPLDFQWQLNGTNLVWATTNHLAVLSAQASDAGTYTLLVGNGAGSAISSNATLTVLLPPHILIQPASQIVDPKSNVTFTVIADGAAPLHYQWRFKGTNLAGATLSSLTRTNLQATNAGSYSVFITNVAGSTLSSNAVLLVQDVTPPTVKINLPQDGQRITNTVVVVTGTASDNIKLARVLARVGTNAFVTASGTTLWSVTLTGLVSGTNTIEVKAVDALGNESIVATRNVFRVLTSRLTVRILGSGLIVTNLNGRMLENGASYTMTAIPSTNWFFKTWSTGVTSSEPVLNFVMQSNLILVANFTNPFLTARGVYNGLFSNSNGVARESAGFASLTVAANGLFSGRVMVEGQTHIARGKFIYETATTTVSRLGKEPLQLTLNLSLTNQTDRLRGTIATTNWTSELVANRSRFHVLTNPATMFSRRYTMLIPPTNAPLQAPEGYGYASITNNLAGSVLFSGSMADATIILPQAAPLSSSGDWPFYAQFYPGTYVWVTNDTTRTISEYKGLLTGWIHYTNDAPGLFGSVAWIKSPMPTALFYPQGFTNYVDILGSIYLPPTNGTRIIDVSNAALVLDSGNLNFTLTNLIRLSTNNLVTVTNANTNRVALSLVPLTGTFAGSFLHPVTKRTTVVKGAVLQRDAAAGGYFLGTNQSGGVTIEGR